MTPILVRLVDNRAPHDAHHDINKHQRRKHGDAKERGYSAYRGGRYNSDEDRMAPEC